METELRLGRLLAEAELLNARVEKYNSCHDANGMFCSTGGSGGGGASSGGTSSGDPAYDKYIEETRRAYPQLERGKEYKTGPKPPEFEPGTTIIRGGVEYKNVKHVKGKKYIGIRADFADITWDAVERKAVPLRDPNFKRGVPAVFVIWPKETIQIVSGGVKERPKKQK